MVPRPLLLFLAVLIASPLFAGFAATASSGLRPLFSICVRRSYNVAYISACVFSSATLRTAPRLVTMRV